MGAVTRIVFDRRISDPANITGHGEGAILDILAKMRRCLCKKTAEGEVAICYLDNSNSNMYAAGPASVLTGTQGDVMVYKPAFYYKYEAVDNGQFAYLIAEQGDDTWIYSPASLIGAYKSYNSGGKLYSRSGAAPTGSISQANSIVYGRARGTGYNIIDFEQHCMIALLFYAKYGTRDSQAVLGAGAANYATVNGSTNSRGNADTVGATSGHASFAGIEGVHGCVYEWVSGIAIENYVWTATDPDSTRRQIGTASSSGGNISEIAAARGPHFDLMPIAVGGNTFIYYADQYYSSTGSCVLARSFNSTSTNGGISCTCARYGSSYTYIDFASRLAFRGIINEVDRQTFMSLPVL